MERLNNIIQKIETDNRFMISVKDNVSNNFVCKYLLSTHLLDQHETANAFFEDLYSKGIRDITIQQYRKNGTGKLKDGEPIQFTFGDKNQPTTEMQPIQQPIATQQPTYQPSQPKQAMNLDFFGLNAPELMNLFVQKNEAERLRVECSELKATNRKLQEDNEKLKAQELEDKYNWQKEKEKKGDTNQLLGQAVQALPSILDYLKNQNNPPALNAPINYGSSVKNELVTLVSQCDDDTASVLTTVLQLSNQQEFATQLLQLINQYNTI